MNYWATANDEIFCEGHYVEAWEMQRLEGLAAPVRALLADEARLGNKLKAINKWSAELSGPLSRDVLGLPDGMAFLCPIHHSGVQRCDGDEDGAVVCLATGFRVYPTRHESVPPAEDAPGAVRSAA